MARLTFRIWRAQAADPDAAAAYAEHLRGTVFPELEGIEGHEAAYLLQRPVADGAGTIEILVITVWRSLEDVRRFAGDALSRAVIAPDARVVLARFDEHVAHYDVVAHRVTPS